MAERQSREGELLAGKYRLEKLLGSGGMGQVYRAENTLIGRPVAIKVLNAEHAKNPEVAKRFLREARAANRVRHENVVDVLDMGEDAAGAPFIVQELLAGEDLGQRLEDFGGRLPVDMVMQILLPVIDAVGYAHTQGVVHRDLKPGNIFLARHGSKIIPKLLDFGISHVTTTDARLTATDAIMGTPGYMSPEQVQGSRLVDARTDVWALGVILYEVLSGEMPFEAETGPALFVKIATADPIPIAKLVPSVAPGFARVVERCMRRERDQRYPSAVELARDLRNVQTGQPLMDPAAAARSTVVNAPSGAPPPDEVTLSAPVAAAPTLQAVAANLPELELPVPPRRPAAAARAATPAPEIPALDPPRPRPPHSGRARAAPPSIDSLDVTRNLDEDAPMPLDLAADRPVVRPRIVARNVDLPAPVAFDPKRFVSLGLTGAAVIAGLGLLSAVNPTDGGWPLMVWLSGVYRDLSDVTCAVIGAAFGLGAIMLVVRSFQAVPTAWGGIVASGGLAMFAAFALAPILGHADPTGRVPLIVPLGVALVPFGVALLGLQRLLEGWVSESSEGRATQVAFAVLGLFAGIQVARGADVQPPPKLEAGATQAP